MFRLPPCLFVCLFFIGFFGETSTFHVNLTLARLCLNEATIFPGNFHESSIKRFDTTACLSFTRRKFCL